MTARNAKAEGFTHRGRLNGIPVYVKDLHSEGPTLMGTNFVFDWLVLHFAPFMQGVINTVMQFIDPLWEPCWAIEITGEL